MAYASGKILLFGEHAVVHHQPALAAALACGVSATARPGSGRTTIAEWGIDVTPGQDHRVARALDALRAALPFESRGLDVDATASLPAGAGVGSSAAMAVAVARALAEGAGATVSDEVLFEAAMAAERVFHGNPSGHDHAIAMHGGLVRFVRGTPPRIDRITPGDEFCLVVAQVAPGADTGRMVAGVAARRVAFGAPIDLTIEAIGRVVDRAQAALEAGDHAALGTLLDINHGLLVALGVSTRELDAACHTAREAGARGAKMTGAGGGGCLIALVDAASEPAVKAALAPLSLRLLDARIHR
jgi:mevalonate kinase